MRLKSAYRLYRLEPLPRLDTFSLIHPEISRHLWSQTDLHAVYGYPDSRLPRALPVPRRQFDHSLHVRLLSGLCGPMLHQLPIPL
jgi:hypothetical protein